MSSRLGIACILASSALSFAAVPTAGAEEHEEATEREAQVEPRGVFARGTWIVAHAGPSGQSSGFPDVCHTPAPPAPFAPAPYPEIGASASELEAGRYKVKGGGELVVEKVRTGKSAAKTSSGDEAGVMKGVVSKQQLSAELVGASHVHFEGKKVVRVGAPTMHNGKTVTSRAVRSEEAAGLVELEDGTFCAVCMLKGRIRAIYKLERAAKGSR